MKTHSIRPMWRSRRKKPVSCSRMGRVHGTVLLVGLWAVVLCSSGTAAQQTPELAHISTLIRHGNFDVAEQRLRRILSRQPHSAKAVNLLGVVYLRQERYAEAEESFRRSIDAQPRFFEALRNLGEACLAEGKTEQAEAFYGEALKIVPDDAQTHFALARLYQNAGQFQRSLDAAGGIAPAKRSANLLPILAADYLGLKQSDKAALEIRAMLQVAGSHPELVPQLADFMLEHGAVGDADELLRIAATRQKQTDRFLYAMSRVEEQKGNRAQARETLAKVIRASPQFLDALVEAGRLAGKDLDWNQAADLLARALQLAPQRVDILQGLAAAQLYGNRLANALDTAKKLQALRPDDPSTAYFMSMALVGNRQWNSARPFAEKVRAARPEDRDANLASAVIAYNLNNFDEAKKGIEFCLRQNGLDAVALFYLGLMQKTEGDAPGAIKTLTKSVAGNPKNADAQGMLGELYLQAGDLTHAREALEEAARLSPGEARNHYQLALLYRRSGLAEKAQEQVEIYQRLRAKQNAYPATNDAPPPRSHTVQP